MEKDRAGKWGYRAYEERAAPVRLPFEDFVKKREEKNQKMIEVLGDNFVCGY